MSEVSAAFACQSDASDIRNLMKIPGGPPCQVFLEALEERIAPASIVLSQGGNLLSAGDEGRLSTGDQSATLVKVLAGKALVFWDAQDKVIKGISVTTGIKLQINGDVGGDIVTNLLSSGSLTDSDNNPSNGLDGGKLLASSIKGITVGSFIDQSGNIQSGSVGRIVAGGTVSNIQVAGSLGGVFSGDGIFDAVATAGSSSLSPSIPSTTYNYQIGFDFDSSGPLNATAMTLTKANATFAPNATITNVAFTNGQNVQIFSGDGFDGVAGSKAVGAAISNVHFVATTVDGSVTTGYFKGKALTISAGDGGSGAATGGPGGAITNVADQGNSGDVVIHSGAGGDGTSTGGLGGKITLLDLNGTPKNYLVQSGDGGTGGLRGGAGGTIINNNIASVSSSQFITLAGDFHTDFTDGALTDAERGFFIINRSSGEMVLIAGNTLNAIPPTILPKASNPVDAVMADVNGDSFLDVVVAYGDGNFGVLVNDQADGFRYSVGSLGGFLPAKVIAGDFLGDGGLPQLAFVSTTGSGTTLTLYQATNPAAFAGLNPASAFSSDPTTIKPFIYPKSGLSDVVGGSFPMTSLGALRLDAGTSDDLVLGFQDGLIQGVYATGSGTSGDPFQFSVGTGLTAAPKANLSTGLRDLDFNFAKDLSQQRLALVNSGGTKAFVATINPPTLTTPSTISIAADPLPLPDSGPVGTIIQAKWANAILDTQDSTSTNLTLLSNLGTGSTILAYNSSLALKKVYSEDSLLNGMTNNFLIASKNGKGQADSFLFTTPSATVALAYQKALPATGTTIPFSELSLPYAAKTVTVIAGDGGAGGSGAGGLGGSVLSLNLDSGSSLVQAGEGGASASGPGGSGGSINNSKTFKTVEKILVTPTLNSSADLTITGGDGASAVGTKTSAKGGLGGSVKSLLILDASELDLSAGNGGNSKGGAAGAGGVVNAITISSGGNLSLAGGNGGGGDTSSTATGGNGGVVTNVTIGSQSSTGTAVTGDVSITAGNGGSSALARGGSGAAVSKVLAGNFLKALGTFLVTAGDGGTASGFATSSNGGVGGAISAITGTGIIGSTTLLAGGGGSAIAGSGGVGGAVSKVTTAKSGYLSALAGDGGDANGAGSKGRGGNGGIVTSITAEMVSKGYSTLAGGNGGSSVGNAGGSGGAVSAISLQLNPSNTASGDKTLGVTVSTGHGGSGISGGAGGLLSTLQVKGIYDELSGNQTIINSIALRLIGGDGGNGSLTSGGAGGAIKISKTFEGISSVHASSTNPNFLPSSEGIRAFAGDGGNGVTKGGAGGLVSGIKVINALGASGSPIPVNLLGGASVIAGNGGNATNGTAGIGGNVSGLNLGVEGPSSVTGNLRVQAGNGGEAVIGTGAAGGSVTSSALAAIKGNDAAGYAVLVTAGNGGDGSLRGGKGGNLTSLTTTLPQVGVANTAPNIYSGVFIAGAGGDASALTKAVGGAGGSISSIKQTQNVYSIYNVVQAGSGGNSSADTLGGAGGSVSSISTVGSIGAQSARATIGGPQVSQGIYNTIATSTLIDSLVTTPDLQQGVFAGLGGSGLADGANGKVSGVKAQNIAAIAAANLSGTFEQAASVASITTLLLGYDLNNSGTYQPGDGFVMAGGNKISALNSLNTQLISTATLRANTAPFIIP